jgi:V/A-type H+/Na+-transporting ATPase subunit I
VLITMRRVDVVAPRGRALDLLRALHRAGSVELVPFEPAPHGESVFGPCPTCPDLAARAGRLRRAAELVALLGPVDVAPEDLERTWGWDDLRLQAALDALEPVRAEAVAATTAKRESEESLARLSGWQELVGALAAVTDRVPDIPGYLATAVAVEPRDDRVLQAMREDLDELAGGRCGVLVASLGDARSVAVLVYPARHERAVRPLLERRGVSAASCPPGMVGRPLERVGDDLVLERERVEAHLSDAIAVLHRLRTAAGPGAAVLAAVLRDRVAEADAVGHAGSSEHLLVLPAWVPASRVADLGRRLAADIGPEAVVVPLPGERLVEYGDPPVSLHNLPIVRAFEPLVSFVGLPRYGSLDPTPALALTFPVFVGFMVGDAGYGLVLLAMLAAIWHRRSSSPLLAAAAPVAALAGISTVLFGVLFGEWFGDVGRSILGLGPLWLDRADAAQSLLVISVAVGAAQVGAGLVLGVVNSVLLHERRQALARGALLCCLVAGILLLVMEAGALPGLAHDGGGGLVVAAVASGLAVGVVVLVVAGGASGPIELVGMFGNVLSYARLMAIGLASVMLAVVANTLGGLAGNMVLAVVVAGTFHALNFGLAFFDASIQALRLHYVEFFSKFVEHGGRRFRPFASAFEAREGPAHVTGR